jgi:IS30 family transposase
VNPSGGLAQDLPYGLWPWLVAAVYFADAYSSWQRGSNENLNGLIRQYYPKRSDFKQLTQKQVNKVQTKLNNRPRKRYNYRTPVEQRAYLLNLQIVAVRD